MDGWVAGVGWWWWYRGKVALTDHRCRRAQGEGACGWQVLEKGGEGYSAKVALISDITDTAKGRVEGRS